MCKKNPKITTCGGEAIVVKTERCGRYIRCWDCGGRTEEFETDHAGSAHDKAIAAWNRRADHIRDTTKKVSNADRIRSLSDEELAKIITSDLIGELIPFCQNKYECDAMLTINTIPEEWCMQCALDWLKEEA